MISEKGHITLRVFDIDSTVHVLCNSSGFNYNCLAGRHIGDWDEPRCALKNVVEVYSVIEH